jgi:hypothetical protein
MVQLPSLELHELSCPYAVESTLRFLFEFHFASSHLWLRTLNENGKNISFESDLQNSTTTGHNIQARSRAVVDSNLNSWSKSLQLYKEIKDVAPAGIMIMGVRDSERRIAKV